MKKLTLLFSALLVSFTLLAQKEATRSLSSFSEISANEGVNVFIKEGSKEEARILVNGSINLEEVLTEVSAGKLKIHLDGTNHRNVDVTVWVTYKSINAVSVSSAGSIVGENRVVTSGDFRVSVSSAGDLELDVKASNLNLGASSAGSAMLKVEVGSIDASASSAGTLEISGKSASANVEASSSGSFKGYSLEVQRAEISASSAGSITLTVIEALEARASSGGSIRYKGSPQKLNTSTSSGGSIKKL